MATKSSDTSQGTKRQKTRPNRLMRSQTDRILGGVCGGLGIYFEVDPVVFRIVFALLTIFGGSGILLYIILWLILPSTSTYQGFEETMRENASEMEGKAHDVMQMAKNGESRQIVGYLLLAVGIWLLLSNYGFLHMVHFNRLWPLFLIILGFVLVARRK